MANTATATETATEPAKAENAPSPVAALPATDAPLETLPLPPRKDASETPPMRRRVRDWIRALYRDPGAEERAVEERRTRLLNEINQAVADAPDDVPIKQLIEQLNRHNDD